LGRGEDEQDGWGRHEHGACYNDPLTLRPILEDMFNDYGVDLVFAGHVHNYERDAPIYKNQTVPASVEEPHLVVGPKAPIYVTVGGAGNREGHSETNPNPPDWERV
jgi:hypothetical protein